MDPASYIYVLYLKIVFIISILLLFSYYDIKYRDIPDKLVWFSLFISIVLFAYSIPYYLGEYGSNLFYAYTLLSLILGIGLFLFLRYLDLIGLADLFVVAEVSLLFPLIDIYRVVYVLVKFPLHLPPILPIILYSAVLSIVVGLAKSLYFSFKYYDKIPRDLPLIKKIFLLLVGRPMTIREYLSSKHFYPLTVYRIVDNKLVVEHRLSFSVEEEEYEEHQKIVQDLIDKKYLSPEDYIWVTYGVPYMVPLLLGFLLFLLVGDTPLIMLFSS